MSAHASGKARKHFSWINAGAKALVPKQHSKLHPFYSADMTQSQDFWKPGHVRTSDYLVAFFMGVHVTTGAGSGKSELTVTQRSCNNCPEIYTCVLISLISLHSKTGQDAPGWWQRCAQTCPQHSHAIESKMDLGFSAIIHTSWVFPTHHSLMVDLNHLIPCMDLLALVCWRLQWRAWLDMSKLRTGSALILIRGIKRSWGKDLHSL